MKHNTSELTPEEINLYENGKTVESQMPLKFPNDFTVYELTVCCAECGCDVATKETKGIFTQSIPTVISFKLIGYCEECELYTVSKKRIRSDDNGSFMEQQDEEEGWSSFPIGVSDSFDALKWLKGIFWK